MAKTTLTLATLRLRLANKDIVWVQSGTATNTRFLPEKEGTVEHTLTYVPKDGSLHVDNGGDAFIKVKMSEKQYRNLFDKYGYKIQKV